MAKSLLVEWGAADIAEVIDEQTFLFQLEESLGLKVLEKRRLHASVASRMRAPSACGTCSQGGHIAEDVIVFGTVHKPLVKKVSFGDTVYIEPLGTLAAPLELRMRHQQVRDQGVISFRGPALQLRVGACR